MITELRAESPPRLLVSVRNADEALAAVRGGADIIDVKEPRQGSLGAASADALSEICRTLHQSDFAGPVSAALGELREIPQSISFPAQLTWVKAGLSHCQETNWPSAWCDLQSRVGRQSDATSLIAVAYADWQDCSAPSPNDVIRLAMASNSPGVLFDTFQKDGRHLLDHLTLSELRPLIDELHAAGLFVALAGSIGRDQLLELIKLQPEIIAVRSAVCVGGRTGIVNADRVAALRAALSPAKLVCDDEYASPKRR